ncbi:MAG: hypothetical protein DMG15_08130 [Acidobacteria bacterium]|nr:MAG: hypothetical protein DMG15_08130 [Acidobacteriota bacterium]
MFRLEWHVFRVADELDHCPGAPHRGKAECLGEEVKCLDTFAKFFDGKAKCVDAFVKCLAGKAKCADAFVKCLGGKAKCVGEKVKCVDAFAKFLDRTRTCELRVSCCLGKVKDSRFYVN